MGIEKPVITVVIPTYNRASVLERCINTIVDQKIESIEILVCDDFSNDNTQEVIEHISKNLPFIRYLKRTDQQKGANAARNYGIEKARGKYIVFVDSDDILVPNSINYRLSVLEDDQTLDMCYGDVLVNGKRVNYDHLQDFSPKKYLMEELSLCSFSTMMVRKDVFNFIPLLDNQLPAWQDDSFVLSLIMNNKRVTHCNFVVAEMIFMGDNITFNYNKRYIGLKNLVNRYHKDIVTETSLFRLLLWRMRICLDFTYTKRQQTSNIFIIKFYSIISNILYKIVAHYFRHIYG